MRAIVLSAILAAGIGAAPAAAGVLAAPAAPGEPAAASAPSAAAVSGPTSPPPAEPLAQPGGGPAEIGFIIVMAGAAITALAVMRRRGVFSARAFKDAPRDPMALPPIIWALCALGLFIAVPLGAALAAGAVGQAPEGRPDLRTTAIAASAGYAAGVALIALIIGGRRSETARAGLRMKPIDVATGLGALLLIFPVIWTVNLLSRLGATAIARLTDSAPPESLAHSTLRELADGPQDLWWWLTVATVTIGAPVVEETLYRGFLQSAFAGAFKSRWGAIIMTSVFFVVAHIGAADAHVLVGLFTLSVALGVIFERTGRLGVAIAVHAAFNVLNILLAING